MSFRNDYETLYGVSLLDDLHNYFPALLYDSSQFSNAQQVLSYIQQQTRRRFDLFSHGQENYRRTHPLRTNATFTQSFPVYAPPSAPSQNEVDDEEEETIHFQIPIGQPRTPPLAANLNRNRNRVPPSTVANNALNLERILLNSLASTNPIDLPNRLLMSTLFNLIPDNPNTDGNFMEPVHVRPTQQQINVNTTSTTLSEASPDICTICQDSFSAGSTQRIINACHHKFHTQCIDTWFQRNVHCPVCRHDIRDPAPPTR